jgi:uncharacterized membrane protein
VLQGVRILLHVTAWVVVVGLYCVFKLGDENPQTHQTSYIWGLLLLKISMPYHQTHHHEKFNMLRSFS